MVNPIQAAPVEVEKSSNTAPSATGSGFSAVFENVASQGSGESGGQTELAAARTGEKAKGDLPKRSEETKRNSDESAPAPGPSWGAMPLQIVPPDNTAQNSERVSAPVNIATSCSVAEGQRSVDLADMASRVEQADTMTGSTRPVEEQEEAELSARGLFPAEIPSAMARRAEKSRDVLEGEAFEKGQEKSCAKEMHSVTAKTPDDGIKGSTSARLENLEVVPEEPRAIDFKTTELMLGEVTESSRTGDSPVTKVENATITIAERSAKPQNAESVEATVTPVTNQPQAIRQVPLYVGGQLATVEGNGEKPALMRDRKASGAQSVQNATEMPASIIDANTEDGSFPARTNGERTAESHLQSHVTNHSREAKVDSVAIESPSLLKNTNGEGSVGLTSAAVIRHANDPGSAQGREPAEPSGSVTARSAETSMRLPEGFVPGGRQLLLRVSHQEMRFGWNTPDFGPVEVRATVEHDRVGAVVSADARLCDSLQADLGSLSRSLANQSLQLTHFQTSSSGSDGHAARGQETAAQSERPASEGANWRAREIRESVLSIHQGALDLRA